LLTFEKTLEKLTYINLVNLNVGFFIGLSLRKALKAPKLKFLKAKEFFCIIKKKKKKTIPSDSVSSSFVVRKN